MIAISKDEIYPHPSLPLGRDNDIEASKSSQNALSASDHSLAFMDPLAEMVAYLNSTLKSADEVLLWAHDHFPKGKLIQVTSFGPSGMVILHKMHKLGILGDIPTASIDTLHLFPETYEFIERVRETYGDEMKLRTFRPEGVDTMKAFDERYGANLWRDDPDKYADLAKVEPMDRAMDDLDPSAWITGRRGSQGSERAHLEIFEIDAGEHRIKINPLAHWTYDQVWHYIRSNAILYNPLHDEGYKSVGDIMTTRAVAKDADERSGRFVGLGGKTECGLHSRNRPKKALRKKKMAVAIKVTA